MFIFISFLGCIFQNILNYHHAYNYLYISNYVYILNKSNKLINHTKLPNILKCDLGKKICMDIVKWTTINQMKEKIIKHKKLWKSDYTYLFNIDGIVQIMSQYDNIIVHSRKSSSSLFLARSHIEVCQLLKVNFKIRLVISMQKNDTITMKEAISKLPCNMKMAKF